MSNTVVGAGVQTENWQRTPEAPTLGGAMSSHTVAGGTPTEGTSGARDRVKCPPGITSATPDTALAFHFYYFPQLSRV